MINKEKYSMDKIAFLGLFVLSIVIASFIVSAKSVIKLTEPIELEYASLAVPVPQGWIGDEQWKYKNNAYSLLRLRQTSTGFIVQFKYLLGFSAESLEEVFAEKANVLGAEIFGVYEIENENLKINWVHLENKQARLRVLFGIAKLPHQRFLTIEVRQDMSDKNLAEEIFTKIAKGIQLTENKPLVDGEKLVSELKEKGISAAIDKYLDVGAGGYYQDLFLVKSLAGKPLGFTSTLFAKAEDANKPDIRAATSYRLPNRAQITHLQSDNNFDKLSWKSDTGEIDGLKTTRLEFENGVMTIDAQESGEQKYKLSAAAIPKPVFELFLPQILDQFENRIIIDSILYDGRIIPTLITKSQTNKNVIELRFLGDAGLSRQYHIDDSGRIKRSVGKSEKTRSTKEQILKLFPKAQSFLLKLDELLKQ